MRRRYESNPNESKRNAREGSRDGDIFELKFLIPSKAAGAIIGKGGEHIQRLRDTYPGINISIPDSQSPERVLIVSASTEDDVLACVGEMLRKLDEVNRQRGSGSESELRLLVHTGLAGAVIGRAGFKIKELREQTNVNLKVYSECCPMSSERVVQLTGETDNVLNCLKLVCQVCDTSAMKGNPRPYDSNNYDPSYSYEYGGFAASDKSWRGGGSGGPGFYDNNFRMHGPGGRGGFSPMVYGAPPPRAPMGPASTNQVTIPNDLAGIVIGKGGERIGRIRAESGAHIIIDPSTDSNDDRIITITGTPNEIAMAQFLLQQAVRNSPSGRKYIQQQLGMK